MFIDLYIFNTNIKITHGCDSNYLVVVSSGEGEKEKRTEKDYSGAIAAFVFYLIILKKRDLMQTSM